LHFAYSHDALFWGAIGAGKVFLRSTVGGGSFRDPHVMLDPSGTYHVVWTTTCVPWADADCVQDHGFGHTTSRDLVTFADPSYIEIPRDQLNVEHVWAPETFYDTASAQYLVSWSSPVDVTPAADPHGIYYMLTKDFVTFSDPALLYGRPGSDIIDATLVKQGNRYLMFVKAEAAGQKNVRVLASESLFGSSAWLGEVSAPLTGGAYAAEGPSALVSDGRMLLFFDKYAEHSYGALRSRSLAGLTDPAEWEDISSSVLSNGLRHGSAIEVPFDVLRAVAIRAAQ
jgi:sucrose-6-phosphate hydrolase SacC (GH32 family)